MKLKQFLAKIWSFIAIMWAKATDEVKTLTPIAIKAVNVLKTINETTSGDVIQMILEAVIPGSGDGPLIDKLRERLKCILPKILTGLQIGESIANIQDPNEQLKAIIAAINMSPDSTKNMYYHGLCALIIEDLADGKLTLGESAQIAEFYYTKIYKK